MAGLQARGGPHHAASRLPSVGVRAVAEAVTRAKSTDLQDIRRFMVGPDFTLAAFKGVPPSFRPWDRQLRQPILIGQPAALVSVAPEAAFLHQRTPP